MRSARLSACTLALAVLCAATGGFGLAAWPERYVRLVVPFIAGGGTDIHARIVAEKLHDAFKEPFVVDNIPGGTGQVGYANVARSAPDGYSLVMGTGGLTILPSLYSKLGFEPLKDFQPISQLVRIQNVMVVHPSVPANTLQEFVALAKASPGQIEYASTGIGNPPHLSGELLKSMAGIEMHHVPYKADNAVMPDLIAGRVKMFICPLAIALPFIESRQVRPLAVTARTRAAALPDVPTMAEAGLPGYEIASWYGVLAPAGTPRDIVDRLNAALRSIVAMPDVREKFVQNGSEPTGTTVEEFEAIVRGNLESFARIIQASGVKPQ